jgi:3-dehydroquinate dehydratase-1
MCVVQGRTVKQAKDIVARGRVLGDGRGPLVCIPVVGRQRAEVLDELSAAVSDQPELIEWRADFFDNVAAARETLELLADIRELTPDIPLIFTLRTEREGGEAVELDDDGIASLCVEVCQSGLADFVDYEMSAPEAYTRKVIDAAKDNDTQVVLSYHNFEETPDLAALAERFATAEALGADVAKVAVMPRSLDDVLVLLQATLQASREVGLPLISISMGQLGAFTRAVGWYFGSSVTFAAGRQESAPGQVPVDDLRDLIDLLARLRPDQGSTGSDAG